MKALLPFRSNLQKNLIILYLKQDQIPLLKLGIISSKITFQLFNGIGYCLITKQLGLKWLELLTCLGLRPLWKLKFKLRFQESLKPTCKYLCTDESYSHFLVYCPTFTIERQVLDKSYQQWDSKCHCFNCAVNF